MKEGRELAKKASKKPKVKAKPKAKARAKPKAKPTVKKKAKPVSKSKKKEIKKEKPKTKAENTTLNIPFHTGFFAYIFTNSFSSKSPHHKLVPSCTFSNIVRFRLT